MQKNRQPYSLQNLLSSLFMMLALAWLTVCLPYVNESQELTKNLIEQSGGVEDTDCNPLSNTTEEKTESGTSLPSEYLHDMEHLVHHFMTLAFYYKCPPADLYNAYHPDLVIPPPEV